MYHVAGFETIYVYISNVNTWDSYSNKSFDFLLNTIYILRLLYCKRILCCVAMYEGLDGKGGVWYSLFIKKFSPLFISLKFWVIH